MTIENLASVVMSELGFINAWLMILTLICIVGVTILVLMLRKQNMIIDELSYQIHRLKGGHR